MQLTFLQADRPLTKKYTKRSDGGYDKSSYTGAYHFSSIIEDVNSTEDLLGALNKHADLGNCLHTGSFSHILKNEPRKGKSDKDEERTWITLDLDQLTGFNGTEDFIKKCLPDAFHNVSYVLAHSASSGIKPDMNMHVFFLLDRPEHMKDIRTWLTHTNLVTKELSDQLTLTSANFGLSYPLDRVANDNGRPIYLAPPVCEGFEDPIKERIVLIKKDHDEVRFNFQSATKTDVKKLERAKIDELRAAAGLDKKRHKKYYRTQGDIDVLLKELTEPGRIHDVEQDNEYVMRCNIDGGDSHAYFYYVKSPELIRNHKGEPAIEMECFDKEFYDKVAKPAAKLLWEKDVQPFVFRNIFDDQYYVGLRKGRKIIQQPHTAGSNDKIKDYYMQYSNPGVPDPKPTWSMEFRPDIDEQWNPDDLVFNTWNRSDYMANAVCRVQPPPVITKVIKHVVGGDEEAYNHFMNWLAFIYQNRTKTGTAWIFHGVQGTGKGVLMDHIISPIFGHDYVAKMQIRGLSKDNFDSWLEKSIFVNIDEFDMGDAGREASGVMQNLKMWITDKFVSIRGMRAARRKIESYSNFILTTNARSSMAVDDGDRRMNFGARQEERLVFEPGEFASIPDELHHFAGYLLGYEVNTETVNVCLENTAKEVARELGRTSIEEFVDAIHDGDLQYFLDGIDQESDTPGLRQKYEELINVWISDVKNDRPSGVSTKDMQLAYRMLCNEDKNLKQGKFLKIMSHKALPAGRPRVNGKQVRGWRIDWVVNEATQRNIGAHIQAVTTASNIDNLQKEIDLASPKQQQ